MRNGSILLILVVYALWIKIKKAADVDISDQRVNEVSAKPIKPVLSAKETFLNLKSTSDPIIKQAPLNQAAGILEKASNLDNIMNHPTGQIGTSTVTITATSIEERLQTKKDIERLLKGC